MAPTTALPPASVAKVVTTLYAIEASGPGARFITALRASGPIADGALAGDLALVGGGDPTLDTDDLGTLAAALGAAGLRSVGGRFRVAEGALPAVATIDRDQPAVAGYNATIGGTNLNFNRVLLAWSPGAHGPSFAFSAPGEAFTIEDAPGFVAEVAPAGTLAHRAAGGREIWTLPRPTVAGRGSVWLPVRAPGAYAGRVFRALAADAGLALPEPALVRDAGGATLAVHESPPLDEMLRAMLRYSTNITAECIGLRASQVRGAAPHGLAASGAAMTAWAKARFGLAATRLVNHSGLGDASHTTAREMTAVLSAAADGPLPALLLERPLLDADSNPVAAGGARVLAKTGTLNFASGLAGYLLGERRLAFAIFSADAGLRAQVLPDRRDDPPGAAAWAHRARALEQAILRRWAAQYA